MVKVKSSLQCPRCDHREFNRTRRSWWMRLLPNSRLYSCDSCDSHILFVLKKFYLSKQK